MRVTLIAAQSVDGFITRHDQPGTAFTSTADKAYFATVLRGFDCSVMGRQSYEEARTQIRAKLTAQRRRLILTRDPARFANDTVPDQLEFTNEDAASLLARLSALGHRSCALLGGAHIHDLFLTQHCVDELWLTLEPRVFGTGTPLVRAELDVPLRLLEATPLDGSDSLLVKYAVVR